MFHSIVHSQATRYRRIISHDNLLAEELSKLAGYFYDCGFPQKLVEPIIERVRFLPRSLEYNTKDEVDGDFLVPFLTPYGAAADELKTHVNGSVNTALKRAPVFENVGKSVIRTVFKRGKTLSDMLFKQKDITLDKGPSGGLSVRCISEEEAKHKRGRKCQTCPLMSNAGTVTLNNGQTHSCEGGDCKSRNVIYLFQCTICSKGYVGKTDQPLHMRVNGHRNCEKWKDGDVLSDFQALKYHTVGVHNVDFNSCFKLFIVKNVSPAGLGKSEIFFINKFKCKEPFGLNIDNPLGMRLTLMC